MTDSASCNTLKKQKGGCAHNGCPTPQRLFPPCRMLHQEARTVVSALDGFDEMLRIDELSVEKVGAPHLWALPLVGAYEIRHTTYVWAWP